MNEFTGDYQHCMNCGHTYDYNDICPECGSDNIVDINAKEVKAHYGLSGKKEFSRVVEMLERHGETQCANSKK